MGTHAFERFIENVGKLELSLKDKLNKQSYAVVHEACKRSKNNGYVIQ